MSSNRTVRLDFSGVEYHCLDALVFSCLGSFTVTLLGAVAEHWVVLWFCSGFLKAIIGLAR